MLGSPWLLEEKLAIPSREALREKVEEEVDLVTNLFDPFISGIVPLSPYADQSVESGLVVSVKTIKLFWVD